MMTLQQGCCYSMQTNTLHTHGTADNKHSQLMVVVTYPDGSMEPPLRLDAFSRWGVEGGGPLDPVAAAAAAAGAAESWRSPALLRRPTRDDLVFSPVREPSSSATTWCPIWGLFSLGGGGGGGGVATAATVSVNALPWPIPPLMGRSPGLLLKGGFEHSVFLRCCCCRLETSSFKFCWYQEGLFEGCRGGCIERCKSLADGGLSLWSTTFSFFCLSIRAVCQNNAHIRKSPNSSMPLWNRR